MKLESDQCCVWRGGRLLVAVLLLLGLVAPSLVSSQGGPQRNCDLSSSEFESISQSVLSDLQSQGWTLNSVGQFKFLQGDTFGANPSSLYGLYDFGPLAHINLSGVFHIGSQDAFVFFGCTPPQLKYYSFRSYVFNSIIPPAILFASLGDSMNQLVINTTDTLNGGGGSPFAKATVVITTPDINTDAAIRASFDSNGFSSLAINTDTVPSSIVRLGTSLISDLFVMLMRVAIFEDEVLGANYTSEIDTPIYWLSPPKSLPSNPFPVPELRPQATNSSELYLAGALAQLVEAVTSFWAKSSNGSYVLADIQNAVPDDLNGFECIADKTDCLGDNHDATYSITAYNNTLTSDDVYMVVGVNHEATNKAVYSNFALYLKASPVSGSDSTHFNGSVAYYAPDIDESTANLLFAYQVARYCGGYQYCLEVTADQISGDDEFAVVTRAYLQPSTRTAPLASELLPEYLLHFTLTS